MRILLILVFISSLGCSSKKQDVNNFADLPERVFADALKLYQEHKPSTGSPNSSKSTTELIFACYFLGKHQTGIGLLSESEDPEKEYKELINCFEPDLSKPNEISNLPVAAYDLTHRGRADLAAQILTRQNLGYLTNVLIGIQIEKREFKNVEVLALRSIELANSDEGDRLKNLETLCRAANSLISCGFDHHTTRLEKIIRDRYESAIADKVAPDHGKPGPGAVVLTFAIKSKQKDFALQLWEKEWQDLKRSGPDPDRERQLLEQKADIAYLRNKKDEGRKLLLESLEVSTAENARRLPPSGDKDARLPHKRATGYHSPKIRTINAFLENDDTVPAQKLYDSIPFSTTKIIAARRFALHYCNKRQEKELANWLAKCNEWLTEDLDSLSYFRAGGFLLTTCWLCKRDKELKELVKKLTDKRGSIKKDSTRINVIHKLSTYQYHKEAYLFTKDIEDEESKTYEMCRLAFACACAKAKRPWLSF